MAYGVVVARTGVAHTEARLVRVRVRVKVRLRLKLRPRVRVRVGVRVRLGFDLEEEVTFLVTAFSPFACPRQGSG